MKKLGVMIFLILLENFVSAQSDSLKYYLSELKKELFKPDIGKSPLYTFIFLTPTDPDYQQIDSTKLIKTAQPDPYKAIEWIKKIAFIRNHKCMEELQQIYDAHMTNFMEEWSQVFLDNYYMCESISSRFQVLAAFEQALTSLSFSKRKLNPKQIFQYAYNHYLEVNQMPSKNGMKDYVYYSKYMYSLNPNNYPFDFVIKPFNSIDPWFEELKPEFIAFLVSSKWLEYSQEYYSLNWKDVNKKNWKFNKYYTSYYYKIDSPEIKDYIKSNIDLGIRNVPNFIFWYGLKIQDYEFNSFIIDHLFALPDSTNNYTIQLKENLLALITRNDTKNVPIVMNSLLKMAYLDPEIALKNSEYLPYDLFDEYVKQSADFIHAIKKRRQDKIDKWEKKNN